MKTGVSYTCAVLERISVKEKEHQGFSFHDIAFLKDTLHVFDRFSNVQLIGKNAVIVYAASETAAVSDETDDFLLYLQEQTRRLSGRIGIGLGTKMPIAKLNESYRQALDAAALYGKYRSLPENNLVLFSKVRTETALVTMAADKRLAIHENTVAKLKKFDDDHKSDLLYTLQTYIDSNMNTSLTARTLYIHRNTLLFRLKKIEDLLEVNLNDIDTIFFLKMALLLSPYL